MDVTPLAHNQTPGSMFDSYFRPRASQQLLQTSRNTGNHVHHSISGAHNSLPTGHGLPNGGPNSLNSNALIPNTPNNHNGHGSGSGGGVTAPSPRQAMGYVKIPMDNSTDSVERKRSRSDAYSVAPSQTQSQAQSSNQTHKQSQGQGQNSKAKDSSAAGLPSENVFDGNSNGSLLLGEFDQMFFPMTELESGGGVVISDSLCESQNKGLKKGESGFISEGASISAIPSNNLAGKYNISLFGAQDTDMEADAGDTNDEADIDLDSQHFGEAMESEMETELQAQPLAVLEGHASKVMTCALSHDGLYLASAGHDRKVSQGEKI